MLTFSLLLALPLQDDAKVTLDLPITPLPAVFKQLEAQTGFGYQVTGSNRNQQVFIRVKDMPSAKLREAIAKVTDGHWTLAGSTWALITKNDSSIKETAYRKSISAWFAKQKPVVAMNRAALEANLKRSLELSKQAETDNKKMMELYALGKHSPKDRFASRLILGIGLNELLTLNDQERRVYAFNPTSLQKSLPASASSALAEYKREQAEYLDSVSRIAPANLNDDDETYGGWNPLIDPYRNQGPTAPPATIMFALRRTRGTVTYELLVYDAKGARVETEGGSLGADTEDMMMAAEEFTGLNKAFDGLDVPVNLSEDDKIFAKDLKNNLFGGMMMGGPESKEPTSETTKQRLLNMDKQDPLTFGPTQMLQQYSDVKKKQVVAKLTDLALFSVAFGVDMNKPATLGSAISLALGSYGRTFEGYEETDDLITLKPTQTEMIPFPTEMDRKATAQFLRSIQSGSDSLEAVATLAAGAENAEDIQLPILLSMLFGGDTVMFFAEQGFDLVKLYGQLNQTQKLAVKNGGLTIPFNNLTGPLAVHARKMLLSGDADGQSAIAMAEGMAPDDEGTIPESAGRGSSYNDEITVKLAKLPANSGWLHINMTGKEELFIKTAASMFGGSQIANPSMVAYSLLTSEQNPNEQLMKVSGYSYGVQRTLTAKFNFAEETVHTRSIQTPLFAKDAKLLKLTDLPADFQKQVQELLVEYRKQMQTLPMGGGGGGAAKPPAR